MRSQPEDPKKPTLVVTREVVNGNLVQVSAQCPLDTDPYHLMMVQVGWGIVSRHKLLAQAME
mgnify:CR=1 FL=1